MQLVTLSTASPRYPTSFTEALRQRRIAMGLTQLDVAQRIPADNPSGYVHPSSISQWEKGQSVPSPNMMAAWAEALGVRVVVGLQEIPANDAKADDTPKGGRL